jgi:hypothetical protein
LVKSEHAKLDSSNFDCRKFATLKVDKRRYT